MADHQMIVSKILSYATLFGSLITQAPQISKIIQSKSAAGLSSLAWILSTCSTTLSISYNMRMGNHFSTWGESLFVGVQVVFLILLKRHYDGNSLLGSLTGLAALAAVTRLCFLENTPAPLLVSLSVPFSCTSSLPQIVANFRNGNTGQLSWVPVLLAVIGLSIRIFTTLMEIDDPLLLLSIAVPCAMNAVLLLQFFTLPDGDTAAKRKN